jgi:hypothetical protein
MGQTTSSGKEHARATSVAQEFQSLQQLIGDWIIDEQVFLTPNAEPILNKGRMTCRSTIGGLSMIVITEIATTAERTVQLVTFNPKSDRYEQALVNSLSDVGIVNMTGRELDTRSAEEIRIQFGKAATLVWEWTLEQNQNLAGEPGLFVPERIVENRINADLWVLQFFGRTSNVQHGQQGEFLIRQQVVTRANVGCQPQVGCELGCAGLIACAEGCEGLQGPTTQPMLGACACTSQVTGQQQLVTQAQVLPPVLPPVLQQPLVAQQLIAQPGLLAQQQVLTPMPLLVQVAVAPQPCPRQVIRPVPLARTGHQK